MTRPKWGKEKERVVQTGYYAEHRCIPCGNGYWNELPDTVTYATPVCCGKPTVPTGRVQKDGYLLSVVLKYTCAAATKRRVYDRR